VPISKHRVIIYEIIAYETQCGEYIINYASCDEQLLMTVAEASSCVREKEPAKICSFCEAPCTSALSLSKQHSAECKFNAGPINLFGDSSQASSWWLKISYVTQEVKFSYVKMTGLVYLNEYNQYITMFLVLQKVIYWS